MAFYYNTVCSDFRPSRCLIFWWLFLPRWLIFGQGNLECFVVWLVGYLWLHFSSNLIFLAFKLFAQIPAIKMSHLLVAFPVKMAHLWAGESKVIFVALIFLMEQNFWLDFKMKHLASCVTFETNCTRIVIKYWDILNLRPGNGTGHSLMCFMQYCITPNFYGQVFLWFT